jgi:iron-sulfur cluster assembly accessory protein
VSVPVTFGAKDVAGARKQFGIISFSKEIFHMATTTVPGINPETKPKTAPVTLTPSAISKVKEIMASQNPVPAGLRLSVQGGGCSGFQYSMAFENGAGMMDKVFEMQGLKVFVDATSLMYLAGANVDYVESLEGAGFKFENPNVKSTCGCGSSFQA